MTTSTPSSSTSGNNPSAVIEVASDGRVSSSVCSCAHEDFAPTRARYSSNFQKHIHENMNASTPLKFVSKRSELLQHSASSGSFRKLQHPGLIDEIQMCRNQSIDSLMEVVADAELITGDSTINKMIAPTASPPTTFSLFLPYAFFFGFRAFIVFQKFRLWKIIDVLIPKHLF